MSKTFSPPWRICFFFFWASHGRWHRQSNFSTVASLYSLCKLSCNPPGFLKFSRGKERNIKRLLDPFRSVYFCWYYTFSKIKKNGGYSRYIYTTNQRLFGGDSPDRIGWGGLEKSPKNGIRCCRFSFFSKVWISFFFFPHLFLSISFSRLHKI